GAEEGREAAAGLAAGLGAVKAAGRRARPVPEEVVAQALPAKSPKAPAARLEALKAPGRRARPVPEEVVAQALPAKSPKAPAARARQTRGVIGLALAGGAGLGGVARGGAGVLAP